MQQSLRHLQAGFAAFWAKRARYPRVKSRKRSRQSAEYTRSALRHRDGRLTLAKLAQPLDIGVVVAVGPQPGRTGDRAGAGPPDELDLAQPGRDPPLLDQRQSRTSRRAGRPVRPLTARSGADRAGR
ncbi:hypothetical protein [Pseudonocardia asaccharolytica]|uniref:Uncharacterized protein n=1 Tax=Pseudonocardia asaccharolytica DSM 44247 = NBRC 16224 TaxID=1123024 RepID=A0A511D777_9PSEU|nr:hypothetical protein [Pseudonocardia asaccharolytica]GEL20650.1 hypothetical protein PA7_44870 [Pseudonocardia asaccharolytica DSM 44247 = NBRC 16224]